MLNIIYNLIASLFLLFDTSGTDNSYSQIMYILTEATNLYKYLLCMYVLLSL